MTTLKGGLQMLEGSTRKNRAAKMAGDPRFHAIALDSFQIVLLAGSQVGKLNYVRPIQMFYCICRNVRKSNNR